MAACKHNWIELKEVVATDKDKAHRNFGIEWCTKCNMLRRCAYVSDEIFVEGNPAYSFEELASCRPKTIAGFVKAVFGKGNSEIKWNPS